MKDVSYWITRPRYHLSEVGRRFREEGFGSGDTLLSCLQEGLLIATVRYDIDGWGKYITVRIPRHLWMNQKAKELEFFQSGFAPTDSVKIQQVKFEGFAKEVRDLFKRIILSIVSNATDELSDEDIMITNLLMFEHRIEKFSTSRDARKEAFSICDQLFDSLRTHKRENELHDIYIEDDNVTEFLKKFAADKYTKKIRLGNRSRDDWIYMYEYFLIKIQAIQGKKLHELADTPSLNSLANELRAQAEQGRKSGKVSVTPNPKTVYDRLNKIANGERPDA